jgi:hypothetical protein
MARKGDAKPPIQHATSETCRPVPTTLERKVEGAVMEATAHFPLGCFFAAGMGASG